MVHQRIRVIVQQFVDRGMITPKERGLFDNVVLSTIDFGIPYSWRWCCCCSSSLPVGSHYVDDFRRKWIEDHGAEGEALLGTTDIQSQADLGSAYESIEEMRFLLFTKKTVIGLAVFIILPLVPWR
jgi:hypothetical protein